MKRLILICALSLSVSCNVISTPTPTPAPTLTNTPKPVVTATALPTMTPTSEIAFGDISIMAALDGFTISVPFSYLHQVQNNIILITNEKRSLNISFAGDEYNASPPLTDVINEYLESLEKRGGSFETSEPETILVDSVQGISIDLKGQMGGIPVQGMALAVSPRPDFVLFGFGMSNLEMDAGIWQKEHRAVFNAFLETIQFVDTGDVCPVSTDSTYGYTKANPIQVGGDVFGGPSRARAYLDHLQGPNGETLFYEREGSIPTETTILDAYRITGPGINAMLYLDEYNYSPLHAPVGFTCTGAFPLSAP